MSTVARGAPNMKMMRRTSITSMNGVTLISWVSSRLPSSSAVPIALLRGFGERQMAPIEVAAGEPHHLGAGVGEERPISADGAREHVVDDHRRNGSREAEGGCQQRLGDAGRHHGEIGGVRLGDADEAVHDAPYGAEQADERRGCPDRGEEAGAARNLV